MPSFDIVRTSHPTTSFRIKSVIGTYDLQQEHATEHFTGSIDLPAQWNIGLIVGRSGSGKSTIAQELFGTDIINGYEWTHDNILDDMPPDVTTKEITKTLTAVGFSSPPSWLKPYAVLSNGEKMRCDIARAILEKRNMFVFDEFTSVVDRNVAHVSSLAIQKAIRSRARNIIAVTCHYDVQEWLMPDWVFNTDNMTFQLLDAETQKKNRPKLRIQIYETKRKEYFWNIFKKYHYLSDNFNKTARVFVATCNDNLCALCAVLPFPHPRRKNTWREHRTVVFPDYQGVGIGTAFTDVVAEIFNQEGKAFIATISNPAMIHSRVNSRKWKTTHFGRNASGNNATAQLKGTSSCRRITVAFEYIGEKKMTKIYPDVKRLFQNMRKCRKVRYSPAQIVEEFEAYIEDLEHNQIEIETNYRYQTSDDMRRQQRRTQKIARPPKVTDFVLRWLGMTIQWWYALPQQKRGEEYEAVIERITLYCYNVKFDGTAVGIYNANLIARELGLRDKVAIEKHTAAEGNGRSRHLVRYVIQRI